MRLHSALGALCLLLSVACVVGAYTLAGYWLIWITIPAVLVLWLASRGRSATWLATSLLAVYVILAVIGIMLSVHILLIVVGCIFALAAWDLADFSEIMAHAVPANASVLLEAGRLQSLALMAGISLLLVSAGYWLRLRLPFGVIVLLVLLIAGCILYGVHQLRRPFIEPPRQS